MEREASGEGQADLAGRLSDELWCIVFSFLPAVDVLHLGSTARRFYAISNEEAIWRGPPAQPSRFRTLRSFSPRPLWPSPSLAEF